MNFVRVGGFILLVIAIVVAVNKIPFLKIQYQGEVVNMTISKKPSECFGTKANYYATFEYNANSYTKKIGSQFCNEHVVGDVIPMKFLEANGPILFEHEEIWSEFLAAGVIAVVAIGCMITSTPKSK